MEVAGGILTGSLALLSDAAHMFTDTMALAIAIAAIRLARMPADRKRTFGYYRFEVLAAALNAVLLFLVALYILYEAYERWITPRPIATLGMLAVAVTGLAVNLLGMRLLAADAGRNLNVKGAYLEVWADAVGSMGVIAGALVVHFTGYTRADPIVAVLIAFWVLPRSWALFRQSVNVLLEGVPEGVDLAQIDERLRAVPGVREVHELHVWALGSGRTSLTAHLILDEGADRYPSRDRPGQRAAAARVRHHAHDAAGGNRALRSARPGLRARRAVRARRARGTPALMTSRRKWLLAAGAAAAGAAGGLVWWQRSRDERAHLRERTAPARSAAAAARTRRFPMR